ncbi:MAG: hypothetical protein JKY33_09790 [Bacteroidia bacterium]|nr:hypothetical protein [Bacteroidia bacterium]
MRSALLFFFFNILFTQFAFSQDDVLGTDIEQEEVKYNYNKIMLIPYNPAKAFLVQDGTDRQIAQHSEKDLQEIRRRFQFGLNQEVYWKLMSRYDSQNLLLDNSEDGKKDLESFMRIVNYQYETPYSVNEEEQEEKKKSFWENVKSKLKKPEVDETEDPYTTSKYKKPKKNEKYMNVRVKNNEIFEYMSDKYGTDLFFFINMFELKTDYKTCLDLSTKQYAREVTVHFSIFDKTGTQIYGDKIAVTYNSSSNDITKIIQANFPKVADYIAWNLPERKKL